LQQKKNTVFGKMCSRKHEKHIQNATVSKDWL